jgi:hypothetical protein
MVQLVAAYESGPKPARQLINSPIISIPCGSRDSNALVRVTHIMSRMPRDFAHN